MPFDEKVAETNHVEEIVTFVDNSSSWEYSVNTSPDQTFRVADTNDSELSHFFERPIKIDSFSWSPTVAVDRKIDPWSLYLDNKRVLNRITNYKLLRGDLHIKITINGNAFYYGMILCSYTPLKTKDDITNARSSVPSDLVAASQRPHVYIQPTCCQGASMVLPFVWQYNAFDITSADWAAYAMGELWFRHVNLLLHANGGTDPITVSTFAWMENVSLSIPTSVNVSGILPQAGILDEYSGPVSGPMNTAAQVAGALTRVPVLAPYAKASQLVTSGLAMIAKFLGFSRPVSIEPIESYKPTYMGNMANANLPDTSQKLTYDVKQETVIDSRVCGLSGRDEMGIMSIAQRESYLTTFTWPLTAAADTQLFACDVTPSLYRTDTDPLFPTQTEFHLTPMAYVSLPFKFWRGSIRFRIQIVSSDFNKGRLRIMYDPTGNAGGLTEYNLNYSRIVDISESKDFTVDIGWGQKYPYLYIPSLTSSPFTIGSTPRTGTNQFDNGVMAISVVNELTTPSTSTNPIYVNIFVSAGEDFEVFDPTPSQIDTSSFSREAPAIAAAMEAQAGEQGDSYPLDFSPTSTQVESMCPKLSHTDRSIEVFCGDPVSSVRQLLKRYNFNSALLVSDSVGYAEFDLSVSNFPLYRGYVPGALYPNTFSVTNFNYAAVTMLNFFSSCFVCRRGGIRWKYHAFSIAGKVPMRMVASRNSDAAVWGSVKTVPAATTAGTTAQTFQLPSCSTGAVATVATQNPVLEVEIPFHNNKRFYHGRNLNMTTSVDENFHKLNFSSFSQSTNVISRYCAAAEDYDLSFFLSTPILWIVSDPTAS